MQWNPYLIFNGQCRQALEFYHRCLGGEIVGLFTYADGPNPAPVPLEYRDRIMHGRLIAQGQVLMGSDAPPGQPYDGVKGCSIALQVATPDEARRVFALLSENAQIRMPLQETFWAQQFGMLTDQFGVPWMINCEKPK